MDLYSSRACPILSNLMLTPRPKGRTASSHWASSSRYSATTVHLSPLTYVCCSCPAVAAGPGRCPHTKYLVIRRFVCFSLAPDFHGHIILFLTTVIRARRARVPLCCSVPPEVAGGFAGFWLYNLPRAAADCSRYFGLDVDSLDGMVAFSIFPPNMFFAYVLMCVRAVRHEH